MTDMISKEKRSYVRGDLSFKVKFKTMTPEEYETVKVSGNQIVSPDRRSSVDRNKSNGGATEITPNGFMIEFLLRMDEKLDQIVAMLSKDDEDKQLLDQGTGTNISGSGMNIIVGKPIGAGQVIHANLILSRVPLIFIDVFGEVVRTTPVDQDGKTKYQLGVKFLDLHPNDRERIIACVFQRQREIIRKRKREG